MKAVYLGGTGAGKTALVHMETLERLDETVLGVHTTEPGSAPRGLRQLQRRTRRGSIVDELNPSILRAAREFRPTLVWAHKQEYLCAETSVHFTPAPYFSLDWECTQLMFGTSAVTLRGVPDCYK